MPDYVDVPAVVLARLGSICLGLPDAHEEAAWAGTRWRIRQRTFAHVLTIDAPSGPTTVLAFRSSGTELEVLHRSGHPFFAPAAGTTSVGMVLDGAVDWEEVAELLTESYCLLAPKKLAALVHRPDLAR